MQHAKFEEFCESTLTKKGRSISEASEKIELLGSILGAFFFFFGGESDEM